MNQTNRSRLQLALAVAVTALVALAFRLLVASPYTVDTRAMEPVAQPADVVVGLRGHDVERGDVVVFRTPSAWLEGRSGASTTVSRVVGEPGDEVRCCDAQGRLVVNGISLSSVPEPQPISFRVVVGPGQLFVRGDNPAHSVDSRCFLHTLGPGALVPADQVRARLTTTVWPFNRLGGLPGKPSFTTAPEGQGDVTVAIVEAASDVPC
ncbi:signal peptidase I [Luteococcus sanguinis]|uniref:Signal peptidase I n=1 Tax=Luteococcus sanguinis TaxID=174038 RepID=A0ABW1X1U5_9ACTN